MESSVIENKMIKLTHSESEGLGLEPVADNDAASRGSRGFCCVIGVASAPGIPGYDVECAEDDEASA